jgi:hypothetical protein
MMWNMFTYIIMSQYVGIFRNELNAGKTKVLLKQSAEKRKQDHRDTVDSDITEATATPPPPAKETSSIDLDTLFANW